MNTIKYDNPLIIRKRLCESTVIILLFVGLIIFLFMGLLITGCADAGDSTNSQMFGNEKSALTVRINTTINKIDVKIGELKNRLDDANEETAEKINDQVDKLKDSREELRLDFRDLKNESDYTWEKFKPDVEEAMDDTEEWIKNIDIDFNNDTESINKK